MLKLRCGLLERLLAADPGYCGPRVDRGSGHQAEFVSYRDKVIDTVLGPVTVSRAWYHCTGCGHGLAPKDAELGVAGVSMSPGLAAITHRVAAAGPFAKAAELLEDLAGVRLSAKRVERPAEASGAARAAADRDRAALITARTVVPLPPSPLPAVCRDRRHPRAGDREGKPWAGTARARTGAPAPAKSGSPSFHLGQAR